MILRAIFVALSIILVPCALGEEKRSGATAEVRQSASTTKDLFEENDSAHQVGTLGAPDDIQIEGLKHLDARQIRSALALDLVYQTAARQMARLDTLLSTLKERLETGLLYSGFPDASVVVDYRPDAHRIHAVVSEGRRYTQGEILIENGRGVDADDLVAKLQSAIEPRPWSYVFHSESETTLTRTDRSEPPTWDRGTNAHFDEGSLAVLTQRIREMFADQGYPFARFDVEVTPEPDGTATLRIALINEGSRATVESIRVVGLRRLADDELLEFLGLEVGMPFDEHLPQQLYGKLRESCRFWRHDVFVDLRSTADDRYSLGRDWVDLTLSVAESDSIPPLREPLSEAERVMRRAARWIDNYPSTGHTKVGDLIFELVVTPRDADTHSATHKSRIIFSPNNGLVFETQDAPEGQFAFDHVLLADQDSISVVDRVHGTMFRMPCEGASTIAEFESYVGQETDGVLKNGIALGWRLKAKGNAQEQLLVKCKARCDPISLVNLLHRDDVKHVLTQDELQVNFAGINIHIHRRTGRVLEAVFAGDDERSDVVYRAVFEKDAFVNCLNQIERDGIAREQCFDEEEPITSTTSFLLRQVIAQPLISNAPSRRIPLALVLDHLESGWLDEARIVDGGRQLSGQQLSPLVGQVDFSIPASGLRSTGDVTHDLVISLFKAGPALADILFVRGSWPWTFLREAALYYACDRESEEFAEGKFQQGFIENCAVIEPSIELASYDGV